MEYEYSNNGSKNKKVNSTSDEPLTYSYLCFVALQLGIPIFQDEDLEMGFVIDLCIEKINSEQETEEPKAKKFTQNDFDNF